MTRCLILFLVCFSFTTFAQEKIAESKLAEVPASGFFQIPLSAELTSLATEQFGNIRIYDASHVEVPYLVRQEMPVFSVTEYKSYPMDRQITTGCCTQITLSNTDKRTINNISLRVRNADATKEAILTGSDDGQQWFVLREKFHLSNFNNVGSTSELHVLDFPGSNYSFLRLVINDSSSAPLNVEGAGYYENYSSDGEYITISNLFAIPQHADKETKLVIEFDTLQLIDKLQLSISSPALYHRYTSLYTEETIVRNKKEEVYERYLTGFDLTSTHASIITFPSVKAKKLIVRIDNRDNPPLSIASVNTFQLRRYLFAWLEKDAQYTIEVQDGDGSVPEYDLGYFADTLKAKIPQLLETGDVTRFTSPEVKSFTLFTDRNIIWASIVIVAVLLAYMSVRMIRQTNASDRQN